MRVGSIEEFFDRSGEAAFREVEATTLLPLLDHREPTVIALGGGAVETEAVRDALAGSSVSLLVHVSVDEAWRRVQGTGRPLARDETEFRRRYAERAPLYDAVAAATVASVDDAVLAAGGIHVATGALERLGDLVPGDGPVALVSDRHVAGIYGADAQLALGSRLVSTHELPPGEDAKTMTVAARLWDELAIDRGGTVVALGGGCVTDIAGFVAATHLRGVPWVAVPTTLVGQVDAAIGGKTGLDTTAGKNRVGAFHWPVRTVIDPALLATLPAEERQAGMAEVVKTGLLAGGDLWERPDPELVRRSAAYKAAVCLRDPTEQGERAVLNLGHTFAHALETASGYGLRHGDAVALGLTAALRLSVEHLGLERGWAERVETLLQPRPVTVDRERARAAMRKDKKAVDGRVRLVLLEAPGRPVVTDALPDAAVDAALDRLITG
jgi:3-dehydroquinate synthetase